MFNIYIKYIVRSRTSRLPNEHIIIRQGKEHCCGSGMFIADPDFCPSLIPDVGSQIQKQQQRRRVKNTILFSQKNSVLRIRDVYPGSRILIFTHPGSRISDPGSKNSNKRER
jgi:hypothetical protein